MIFSQGAQFRIGGHAYDLENARILAANRDFLANGIGVTEETSSESLVKNYRHGTAGAIGDFEIAAAQNGNSENTAKLRATTDFISIAGGGKRIAAAAHKVLQLQFAISGSVPMEVMPVTPGTSLMRSTMRSRQSQPALP
jgi:hypothetical protein